jgi:chaperone required for assembly of F1-ATPase
MRDIFADIFANQPFDPNEAARRGMRPNLPRRFYREVSVGEEEGGYRVLLDGRPVRTPARNLLALPTPALADGVAAEWRAQGEVVDPSTMPLTRLANVVLDGVARAPKPVADEVAKYLGSDLLFYRVAGPEGLVERQARHWDPVLAWAREKLGARFILSEGVMFVQQPSEALAAARAAVPSDPWRLGAVHSVTTLTGSALLALALLGGRLTADEAWAAAEVDEDWNVAQWGEDDLARERRADRRCAFDAAAAMLAKLAV